MVLIQNCDCLALYICTLTQNCIIVYTYVSRYYRDKVRYMYYCQQHYYVLYIVIIIIVTCNFGIIIGANLK